MKRELPLKSPRPQAAVWGTSPRDPSNGDLPEAKGQLGIELPSLAKRLHCLCGLDQSIMLRPHSGQVATVGPFAGDGAGTVS